MFSRGVIELVSALEEKKHKRQLFLFHLYELADGNQGFWEDWEVLGNQLGFAQDEALQIAHYLEGEGLIEFVTLRMLSITHKGILQVEATLSQSDEPNQPHTSIHKWDVFISHASEDKNDVVRPLAYLLISHGLEVWYDEQILKLGDSLRRKIDEGLAKSRFGVVVLSPSFFSKEWPQSELDGLYARQEGGTKVIIPVWHEIDHKGVAQFSPLLAGLLAVSTSKGLDVVAQKIMEVVKPEAVQQTHSTQEHPQHEKVILRYGGEYQSDITRSALKFSALAGKQRLICIVPLEDIADKFRLPGGADETKAFEVNLGTIMEAAQQAFDEGKFNEAGELMVRLF